MVMRTSKKGYGKFKKDGNFVELFIEKIVKIIFGKNIQEKQIENIVQFIKFGLVGVSNTVVAYLINIWVLFLLRKTSITFDYVLANIISFLLSVLWSFYWNNKFVFVAQDGERHLGKVLIKTYAAYGLTGIILNNVFSWIWINIFFISKYIAPIINLLISVPINYLLNKLWAFKS